MSDCCLTPNEQFLSYTMARASCNFDEIMMSALY